MSKKILKVRPLVNRKMNFQNENRKVIKKITKRKVY